MSAPMHVIVIGAGAAGMMAAITAAETGAKVTLLEKNPKPGRKLLLTGSGRCNLTHLDDGLWKRYEAEDIRALEECAYNLQQSFGVADTLAFFRRLGLLTCSREGYVYPASNSAESVLFVLERGLERAGVKCKYAQAITGLGRDRKSGVWQVKTQSYTYEADRVILCAGSKACPETGSDGSGYALARQAGHTIIGPVPALTGLVCRMQGLEKAAGSRCAARVRVRDRLNGAGCTDLGQVQWNRDGIAGIVVFQVSGFAARALAAGHEVEAELDLAPEMEREALAAFLREQSAGAGGGKNALAGALMGLLPTRLAHAVAPRLNPAAPADTLKAFSLAVTGVRGFDQAQVCRGGVSLGEIEPATFESKQAPGLYLAGEILDADGPCGGYNLQWAWSTGHVAGKSAACPAERHRA